MPRIITAIRSDLQSCTTLHQISTQSNNARLSYVELPVISHFFIFFPGWTCMRLCCLFVLLLWSMLPELNWFNFCFDLIFFCFRHQSERLLQEHGVGSAGCQSQEESQTLSVLFGTVSRHQVQHHNPSKDSLLHGQSHPSLRGYLFGNPSRLLHPGQLRREDHNGHHDPQLSQHLPAAGRRNQPSHVAGDAAHRQIPALHHGARHLLYNRDGLCVKYTFSVAVDARHGALGPGALSQRAPSTALHAATTRSLPAVWQVPEGWYYACVAIISTLSSDVSRFQKAGSVWNHGKRGRRTRKVYREQFYFTVIHQIDVHNFQK